MLQTCRTPPKTPRFKGSGGPVTGPVTSKKPLSHKGFSMLQAAPMLQAVTGRSGPCYRPCYRPTVTLPKRPANASRWLAPEQLKGPAAFRPATTVTCHELHQPPLLSPRTVACGTTIDKREGPSPKRIPDSYHALLRQHELIPPPTRPPHPRCQTP